MGTKTTAPITGFSPAVQDIFRGAPQCEPWVIGAMAVLELAVGSAALPYAQTLLGAMLCAANTVNKMAATCFMDVPEKK